MTKNNIIESAERILRSLEDGFLRADTNGYIIMANEAIANICGYSSPEEMIGLHMKVLYANPDDREYMISEIHSKGKLLNYELELERKDGTGLWSLCNIKTVTDEKGKVLGTEGVIRDITQRKNMEEQLKAANQLLNANQKELIKSKEAADRFLNVAAEIILILDNKGNISLLNESGHKFLGYKSGELVGKNWFDNCLPKENVKEIKSVFKQVLDGKIESVANYESDIITKSGDIKTILWHNTYFKDENGKIIGSLSSGEDITEQKKAEAQLKSTNQQLAASEQQLKANEQQLRVYNQQLEAANHQLKAQHEELLLSKLRLNSAENLANIGNFIWDTSTGKVTWSDGLYHLLGYKLSDKIDYDKVNQKIHHPEDLERVTEWLQENISSGREKLTTNQYRLIRKDGKVIYVEATGIIDRNEKQCKIFATIQDVSEKIDREKQLKANEQELRAANQQLAANEQQLRTVNQQLKASEIELQTRNQLLRETGSMARVGGWELDVETNKVKWSEETYRLHEIPMDHQPPVEEAINFFHPDDRSILQEALKNAAEKGEPYDLTLRFITAKGKHLITRTICRPTTKDGKVIKLTGTFQDVTDRVKAEEKMLAANQQLAANEQQLRAANQQLMANEQQLSASENELKKQLAKSEKQRKATLVLLKDLKNEIEQRKEAEEEIQMLSKFPSQNPNPIMRIAKNGKIIFNNSASNVILKKWNVKADKVTGEPLDNVKKAITTQDSFRFEIEVKDRYYSLTFSAIPDTDLVNIYGLDITERKLTEQKLKESEEKYRILAENAKHLIITHDFEGKITYANAFAKQYIDLPEEQVIGLDIMQFVSGKKEIEELQQRVQDFKANISDTHQYELNIELPSGEQRVLQVYGNPVRQDGKNVAVLLIAYDITERKKAEIELKESEENLQNTFDLSPSIIAKANLVKGYFIEANKAVTKILGYTVEEFTSKPFIELIHPNDQQDSTEEKVAQIEGKEVTYFENRYLCKDGSYKWIAWFGTKADKDGIVRAIGSDVTDKKKAEDRIKESEARYKQLVETASDAIYLMNEKGVIIDTNKTACQMLKKDFDEIVGSPIDTVDPSFPVKEFIAFWAKTPFGKQMIFETSHLTKQGNLIPIEISGKKFKVGEKIYYYGVARDITERKQTEANLKASEEKFRLIAENSIDCIWTMDKKLRFTYLSPSLKALFGAEPEEWIGTSLKSHFKPKAFLKAGGEALKAIKNFKNFKPVTFETKMLNKQNVEVDVEIAGNTLLDSNGKLIGLQGSTKVITERKLAEMELAKHREHLEELVKEQTKELSEKIEHLQRFHDATIKRELRMKELRDEIEELKKKYEDQDLS